MLLNFAPKVSVLDFNNLRSWDLSAHRSSDIIIIDNFAQNCGLMRQAAINANYERKITDTGYEYNFANPEFLDIDKSLNLIFRVLGKMASSFLLSYFIYETKSNEKTTREKNWVHFDPWSWVGLHYLNLPDQCVGGTSFYRHMEENIFGFTDFTDENKALIAQDGTDEMKWEEILRVQLRWNRLLLFKPCFFHSPSCYFGSEIENARIYQLFTFN